ncbi:trypsin-like serine protease [Gonapodya prolifera JEL478]|uniref:Trypsin-like serine protease n=1 Tax=Gonapodya prolifera (strain JEL478) TaxID=1344416 RepID=A0A139A5H6_GONPJ|nr:trypsin-like serine protease [Gonapodya prolifera JEL478]|eukprot:KXS12004.1 trypsin-like serine protease [Gonapodya prolifera JEL478]
MDPPALDRVPSLTSPIRGPSFTSRRSSASVLPPLSPSATVGGSPFGLHSRNSFAQSGLSQILAVGTPKADESLRELAEVTHTQANYSMPWTSNKQNGSTSTGFVIANRLILTNAHCVIDHTLVLVRRRGDATKHVATVVAIGRDCDLALLTVQDPKFWGNGTIHVNINARQRKLPRLEEKVSVVGYPVGGENLSITSGVVSRLDMSHYSIGLHSLLTIQVDAAINPGNSGGPVFDERFAFIGVAFQKDVTKNVQGIGYIIPVPVVMHFLTQVSRHGRYVGFADMMLDSQTLENDSLRSYLGMTEDQTGIMILKVHPLSPAKGVLEREDVLLEMDGHRIANDGTVEFPQDWVAGSPGHLAPVEPGSFSNLTGGGFVTEAEVHSPVAEVMKSMGLDDMEELQSEKNGDLVSEEGGAGGTVVFGANERIDSTFIISQKHIGEILRVKFLRPTTKSVHTADIVMKAPEVLVPIEGKRKKKGEEYVYLPSWFICGGFVFTSMTESYIQCEFTESGMSTPLSLMSAWLFDEKKTKEDEIVLCSQVLSHPGTVGYEFIPNKILKKVNGTPVTSLKHACELITESTIKGRTAKGKERYLRLDFNLNVVVALDCTKVEDWTKECLDIHNIANAKSPDL